MLPVLQGLLDLGLPVVCAGCAAGGARLCGDCRRVLGRAEPARWWPTPAPRELPPTWSCLPYEGPVRSCVVAWKDEDRVDLTGVLAAVLAGGLAAALRGGPGIRAGLRRGRQVYVVPAPSARAGTARRGRWPVQDLLARSLRAVAAEPEVQALPALGLSRAVADQAGLGARERGANLRGAMTVSARHTASVDGALAVVVDDVVTTGATLSEAARALRAAGAADVVAVTLAATHRHA